MIAKNLALLVFLAGTSLFPLHATAKECPSEKEDSTGYLRKICLHIQNNGINVAPADSAGYHIRTIIERTDHDRKLIEVRLDCCGTGDSALFDAQTKELISFRHGAF